MKAYLLTCMCGWEARGTEDEVVGAAQSHGRDIHNMAVTHDQAMAMAKPADS